MDASAFLEYTLRTSLGRELASVLEEPGASLHSPTIADLEFAAGLKQMLAAGLERQRADSAFAIYVNLPVTRHDIQAAVPALLDLEGVPAHLGAYLALAELLDATLVSGDAELTRAATSAASLNVVGVRA